MTLAACASFLVLAKTTFALPQWPQSSPNEVLTNDNFTLTKGIIHNSFNKAVLFIPRVDIITSADVLISAFTGGFHNANTPIGFEFFNPNKTFPVDWKAGLSTDGIVSVIFPDMSNLVINKEVKVTAHETDNQAPVPEPGTMILLGTGVFCLAIYGKRRSNT
jgi:hypothetical protein